MNGDHKGAAPKLSRGEAETLCILYSIGAMGCPASDLAERLGLSATLAAAVAAGVEPLVLGGLLDRVEDRFNVTDAGRAMFTKRLNELGLG